MIKGELAGGSPGQAERNGDAGNAADRQAIVSEADAGESALLALRVFIGEEIKGLVLLERAAKGKAGLDTCVSLLDGIEIAGRGIDLSGERVACLEGLVAEKTEDVAVEVVGSALGDDVDDATGGAAVLRIVITEDELKFLYGFLGNGGADAVDGVVDGVGAVNADHVGTGARAAHIEAAIGSRADGGRDVASGLRVDEREIDVAAAVNGEVLDAALPDGLRDFSLRHLNGGGFGRDHDGFRHAFEVEASIEGGVFADGYDYGVILENAEVGSAVYGHFVSARREADEGVAAVFVGDDAALRSSGGADDRDFSAADRQALRVSDRPGKRRGVDLCRAGDDTAQNEHEYNRPPTHTHSALHVSSSLDPIVVGTG